MRAAPVDDGGGHSQAQVGKHQGQDIRRTKGEDKAHEVEKHHSTHVCERGKRAFFAFATALCQAYALIKIAENIRRLREGLYRDEGRNGGKKWRKETAERNGGKKWRKEMAERDGGKRWRKEMEERDGGIDEQMEKADAGHETLSLHPL